jgi:hypothetical protein
MLPALLQFQDNTSTQVQMRALNGTNEGVKGKG